MAKRSKRQQRKLKQRAKKTASARQRQCPVWQFGAEIPTYDYLEDIDVSKPYGLAEACRYVIRDLQRGSFAAWDAVVREEQDLPLTQQHQAALSGLISFGDDEEEEVEPILYIDDVPRPSQPWYEIVRTLVSRMVMEKYDLVEGREELVALWPQLLAAIEKDGKGMSLPEGSYAPLEIIPKQTQHRLWLQTCITPLWGIGRTGGPSLSDQDALDRIDHFIKELKGRMEDVEQLGLTLQGLMNSLVMPAPQRADLKRLMLDRLGMNTEFERLASYLKRYIRFKVGESVSIREGVTCPGLEKYNMSGWQGRLTNIALDRQRQPLLKIQLDSVTLRQIPASYFTEAEREGLEWSALTLSDTDLELAEPRDNQEDVEAAVKEILSRCAWVSLGEEGPRIQQVLMGIGPDDDWECMKTWKRHLEAILSFPFDAFVAETMDSEGSLEWKEKVEIFGISDVDDLYGVLVNLRSGRRKLVYPLCDLEVRPRSAPQYQPVKDYAVWFANR